MVNDTTQPTCQGCMMNTGFFAAYTWPKEIEFKTIFSATPVELTDDEKEVLHHLALAWNKFSQLSAKHPDHNNEFKDAIHRAQHIIGVRVAQRVNPEVWYVPVATQPLEGGN